ncbi:hypothetical protein B4U80_05210 [Leptotrombidium deliense]|uniref:Uncharacterized protein n=1 Tax=Leptotrombidium deliense TaxID=299467 RepID=A0A443S7N7_9ACAR|nr:hypothetical protein B4U80_05210 [Leptotrombidium deliense]
MKATFKCAN